MRIVVSANSDFFLNHFEGGLIESLRADGHEVFLVSPESQYKVQLSRKGMNPFVELITLYDYYRLFSRLRPDVVLDFTIKPVIYGSLACKILTIPAINTITGLGSIFIQGGWKQKLGTLLYKISLRGTIVLVLNKDDQDIFRRMGISTKIVPGAGIDTDRFPFSPVTRHANNFLFVGRLIKEKGIQELVEAINIVAQSYPNVALQILGDVDLGNPSSLSKTDLEHLQRNPHITFLGRTNDVRPYIQQADCIVLPSYREGVSSALLEAMSMGRPVITTDVPGCRDLVHDNIHGYIAKVRDTHSLANAMEQFINTPHEQRTIMGTKTRLLVEETYSATHVNSIYKTEIERLTKHLYHE